MPLEGEDEFDVFFDPQVFGESGTYAHGGTSTPLAGIFANAHAAVAPLGDWRGVSM